jgi:hypothetical protein
MSRRSSRASGRCRISSSASGAWSRPPSRSSTRPRRCSGLTRVLRHDGVHAVLSVPVQVAQGTVGSLNFYLAEPHAWDHSERNAAEVYGRLAGALLGSALTAELQGRLIEQLQWALDHRILIEQAARASRPTSPTSGCGRQPGPRGDRWPRWPRSWSTAGHGGCPGRTPEQASGRRPYGEQSQGDGAAAAEDAHSSPRPPFHHQVAAVPSPGC